LRKKKKEAWFPQSRGSVFKKTKKTQKKSTPQYTEKGIHLQIKRYQNSFWKANPDFGQNCRDSVTNPVGIHEYQSGGAADATSPPRGWEGADGALQSRPALMSIHSLSGRNNSRRKTTSKNKTE
jgi:hypothetical protein